MVVELTRKASQRRVHPPHNPRAAPPRHRDVAATCTGPVLTINGATLQVYKLRHSLIRLFSTQVLNPLHHRISFSTLPLSDSCQTQVFLICHDMSGWRLPKHGAVDASNSAACEEQQPEGDPHGVCGQSCIIYVWRDAVLNTATPSSDHSQLPAPRGCRVVRSTLIYNNNNNNITTSHS